MISIYAICVVCTRVQSPSDHSRREPRQIDTLGNDDAPSSLWGKVFFFAAAARRGAYRLLRYYKFRITAQKWRYLIACVLRGNKIQTTQLNFVEVPKKCLWIIDYFCRIDWSLVSLNHGITVWGASEYVKYISCIHRTIIIIIIRTAYIWFYFNTSW